MLVSIITVNYNGEKHLKSFLSSLKDLKYPKDKLEVIVVDNGSVDNSLSVAKKTYPEALILEMGENLGFGGANNVGIKKAKGDLVLLANNDTVLGANSVSSLVSEYKRLSRKSKVGALATKLVLIDRYIHITVTDAFFSDFTVNKTVEGVNKQAYMNPSHRNKKYSEEIFIPVRYDQSGSFLLRIKFANSGSARFSYSIFGKTHNASFASGADTKEVEIKISSITFKKHGVNLVQNAGNIFFRDGFTRDRGAKIIWHKQYYEADEGQYEKVEQVQGFCGAGVLLNKKALFDVGLFDEDLFFYYEDSELSLRMSKARWKLYFIPSAVIRHIHAASSKEWSAFFNYNAEKSRLLMVSKHWPRLIVFREWAKYVIRDTLISSLYMMYQRDFDKAFDRLILRLKVNLDVAPKILESVMHSNRLSKKDLSKFY